MKTFKITQNFGQSCYVFKYFDMPDNATKEEIEKVHATYSFETEDNIDNF